MKPVYEVEWEDHSFTLGNDKARPVVIRSVGYLLKNTPRHVVLAQSKGTEYEERLLILRSCIRKMRKVH